MLTNRRRVAPRAIMPKWPLGVFCSIDEGLGVHLVVAHELGVGTCHLHTPSPAARTAQRAGEFREQLATLGIEVTVVFAGFSGESYADIPTVEASVGLVPLETRAARFAELKQIADFARHLEVKPVGVHLGFVPHDEASSGYKEMVALTQELCDYLAPHDQMLHLETGQEPADVLDAFLVAVARPNIGINFDPANMILYGIGEPLPALKQLGRWVRSIHCKDAKWSDQPGVTWGVETPLGEGDVDFAKFLCVLDEIGYRGPLTIEREIPQEPARQKAEIGGALELLRSLGAM